MSDSSIPGDTKASPELIDELRSFLGDMDQRTPQEAIGIEDAGGLLSSLVISSIGFVVLVMLLTAISYYTPSDESVAQEAQPAPAVGDDADSSDSSNVPDNPAQANGNAPVANPDEVLSRLNIGETKDAAPDENPLDSPDIDRLLDGDN